MEIAERIEASKTRQYRMVFHNAVNDHDTLFGGILMQWMDEAAYITASRFCRKRMVTVKVEFVRFYQAVRTGTVVELRAEVVKSATVKLGVRVSVFAENLITAERALCADADFVFAAVNEDLKPVRL